MIRNTISMAAYTRGIILINTQHREEGIKKVLRASELAHHDVYHIRLAEITLEQLALLMQSQPPGAGTTAVTTQVEQLLSVALGNATTAIHRNEFNYKNFIVLGNIYKVMILFGAPDAYTKTIGAYAQAEKLSPRDAILPLLSAQAALVAKNTSQAERFIHQSLNRYPTRAAYVLLAQIQEGRGDWKAVALSLEQAIGRDPQNILLYLNLGIAYEKSGSSDKANQIYTAIRNQFTDGDAAITKIRKEAGLR